MKIHIIEVNSQGSYENGLLDEVDYDYIPQTGDLITFPKGEGCYEVRRVLHNLHEPASDLDWPIEISVVQTTLKW